MSLSPWMLLCFAGWTLLVLIIGIGVRRWAAVLRGEADLTSFPGDVPHGSASYRRAVRAHANCLESFDRCEERWKLSIAREPGPVRAGSARVCSAGVRRWPDS